MTRRLIAEQRGYAVVTSTMVLFVMLVVGLAIISLSDTGTERSREQRVRESALNLSEGVLYGQGFALAHNWPSTAVQRFPNECTSQQEPGTRCPNRHVLSQANSSTPQAAAFRESPGSTDFVADGSWVASVRDDYGPLEADFDAAAADGTLNGPLGACGNAQAKCTWDFNGNRRMWVKVSAVVRGKPRVLVAKLQLETLAESIPQTAVTTGALRTTNQGNNVLIDVTGSNIIVRCNTNSPNCSRYVDGQIQPTPPQQNAAGNLMTPDQLERFRQAAKTNGKYFDGCPPKGGGTDLSGSVVWVEGCANAPSYANDFATTQCFPAAPAGMSQSCINQITSPGILIWHCGQLDMQGGLTYVGVVYVVNNSDGTCPKPPFNGQIGNGSCNQVNDKEQFDAAYFTGGFGIWGALSVDGPACSKIGSNGKQIQYDPRVFSSIASYGTVGLIQNTWRELPATAG